MSAMIGSTARVAMEEQIRLPSARVLVAGLVAVAIIGLLVIAVVIVITRRK
jgi:hypothetical protein